MKISAEKFKILLCLRKEFAENVRRMILADPNVHIQFTSSPRFLMSRAIFAAPDVVLIDTSFDKDLLTDMLANFRLLFPDVMMYLVSSTASHRDAVDAINLGASGYFALPIDSRHMNERVGELLARWHEAQAQRRIVRMQHQAYNFDQIIGSSGRLGEVLDRAKKVIDNPLLTVLITGETGTGKELLARAIHYNGKNQASPFVDIGCSALPETLLESELFGYEKGAFTDARERKTGLFELAGDGTIFLDEIGDISPAMQSKLLKVIESRTMRRVGGLKDLPVRARIIAATSVDLAAKMKSGQFRKDLYHRLKIIPLELPPLRSRREDVAPLAASFIETFNALYQKTIRGISPEALIALERQSWEGNVRELKHVIERAVLLEEGDILTEKAFGFLAAPEAAAAEGIRDQSGDQETLLISVPLKEARLDAVQRRLALKVLEQTRGNKSKAAFLMRISRPRLDRILKSEST